MRPVHYLRRETQVAWRRPRGSRRIEFAGKKSNFLSDSPIRFPRPFLKRTSPFFYLSETQIYFAFTTESASASLPNERPQLLIQWKAPRNHT